MGPHWGRLAELIRADARQLYRTNQELADAAGLGLKTVEDLTSGRRTRYKPRTLYDIETALFWEPGSAERVTEGGNPRRTTDRDMFRLRRAWPDLSPDARRILADLADGALRRI